MKKERYVVEIEMPDCDGASSTYIRDVIQNDCDIEDEDRWKVSVKEQWKPSDRDIKLLKDLSDGKICPDNYRTRLYEIINNLKNL